MVTVEFDFNRLRPPGTAFVLSEYADGEFVVGELIRLSDPDDGTERLAQVLKLTGDGALVLLLSKLAAHVEGEWPRKKTT